MFMQERGVELLLSDSELAIDEWVITCNLHMDWVKAIRCNSMQARLRILRKISDTCRAMRLSV